MATEAVKTAPAPWLKSTTEAAAATTVKDKNTLGKDEFLKLLISELQNQDPLEPMKDREFISQMANFSALEQMKNLNTGFETLNKTITESFLPTMMLQQSSNLIGHLVSYIGADKDGKPVVVTGTVDKVIVKNGKPYCVIGGTEVDPTVLTEIGGGSGNLLQESSYLVGHQVSYPGTDKNGNPVVLTGTVDKVVVKDGKPYCMINGKEIDASVLTGIGAGSNNDQLNQLINRLDYLLYILNPEEGAAVGG